LISMIYDVEFTCVSAVGNSISAVDNQGNLWVYDPDINQNFETFAPIPLNVKILTTTCLSNNIVGLDVNGNLWVVGSNIYGELGIEQDGPIDTFFGFSLGFPVQGLVNQPIRNRFLRTKGARNIYH